jgi:hypothetical protein
MAYRKPGVTVTQVFQNLVPGLAAATLPCVIVGPAYQLVPDDLLGTYTGADQVYSYASLMGGAEVDLEKLASDELFPVTKMPISLELRNAVIEIVPIAATGSGVDDVLTDLATDKFINVAVGDSVIVEAVMGATIIVPQTNGVTSDLSGQRNRLTAGVAGQFANVKIGDVITVTGGAHTIVDPYTMISTHIVTAKIGSNVLICDTDINDGTGPSTDVAYSIAGDRGVTNAGTYKVKTKTDNNNLVLTSPFADTPEAPLSYSIRRAAGTIALTRVDSLPGNGFLPESTGITLPAGLQITVGSVDFDIVNGSVYSSYRAIRSDLSTSVREFVNTASLTAIFGVGQITPANDLAYGISIAMQNTVTPVNGLGLDGNAVTDEVLSYTAAADVLKAVEMYAISLLTQNPVVHTLFKNHVEQLSQAENKMERVVIFNSQIQSILVLQEESTTVLTPNGSRVIVPTQVDGSGVYATSPKTLIDLTADQFLNVTPGDSLVIVGGTGVTPGTYTVASKTNSNTILTSTNFITSGSPTDIQYYIYRKDGIAYLGAKFYDRNALFISNGVTVGNYLTISEGDYAGRYTISHIYSEKEIGLSPAIPGVVTLEGEITYQVDRNLTKAEQTTYISGYSQSFSSRRCCHVWPDVLEAPVGQSIEKIPGIYGTCPIAALTTGLPPQQGFTNLVVSGFLGLDHSSKYFTEGQLDTIADGGTMILAQEGPEQPLYVRHQLTTDRSAIKTQEFSFTKSVDFAAKFFRTSYRTYVGQYNIIDTTLDSMRATGGACIDFLKNKLRVDRFGGVIRGGALTSLVESETQIDTVEIVFTLNFPIPLNHVDITLLV